MRIAFCWALMLVAAICTGVIADDRTMSVPAEADPDFTVTVRILEVRRNSLSTLGFDSTKPETQQQSPLSLRDFRSQLTELQKSKQAKVLAEPALSVSLNKPTKSFNGGEIAIPTAGSDGEPEQRWIEFGTRVEITPTRQPDGSLNLRWYVSNATYRYSKPTRLFGKKVPVFSRWQSQGDFVVPDKKVVLLIPDGVPDQEDILILQFQVEK